MERLTIKDIARMAGVSHTTVSRALNGARNIRPETYERIMEICRSTGYTLNAAARQLKRSDSGAIGIIVPDISNAFFCELTRHLECCLRSPAIPRGSLSNIVDFVYNRSIVYIDGFVCKYFLKNV